MKFYNPFKKGSTHEEAKSKESGNCESRELPRSMRDLLPAMQRALFA